jgi:hypothetical protein
MNARQNFAHAVTKNNDPQKQQKDLLTYWLDQWAMWMNNNHAEIARDTGIGGGIIGKNALSNYCVASDDCHAVWDIERDKKVKEIDALINDLRLEQPWTYWAICKHLGLMNFWKYPRLDPQVAFINALEELLYLVEERKLVL